MRAQARVHQKQPALEPRVGRMEPKHAFKVEFGRRPLLSCFAICLLRTVPGKLGGFSGNEIVGVSFEQLVPKDAQFRRGEG